MDTNQDAAAALAADLSISVDALEHIGDGTEDGIYTWVFRVTAGANTGSEVSIDECGNTDIIEND